MAAPLATVEKSPTAVLQYTIDWTAWLAGADTIDTVTWTVPAGITSVSQTNTTLVANIKLSGGTVGVSYDVVCTITTVGSLTEQRTLRFVIVER